jgi:pyruvate, water dikinase
MSEYPVPVKLEDASDESLYGGKNVSLGAALRKGLPTPSGFALCVDLVNEVIKGNAAAIDSVASCFEELAPAMAVRSSAVGEDSDEASFAGQHVSILNVMNKDGMLAAIKQVHDSAFTPEALAYRERMNVTGDPAIAVVLQKQILSEVSGVMFTHNPLNGASERYIEASWGLGEAIVSGLVVPDSFRISDEGSILERVAGEKDVELVASEDGQAIEREIKGERVEALCLSDEQLLQLHDLANKCQTVYEEQIDIEWAFYQNCIYLLQCRGITV